MADKAEKKHDAAPPAEKGKEGAAPEKKAGGGLLTKLPVLLGGVMIIEAVVLFAGFKFLGGGGPKAAAGAELVNPDKPGAAAPGTLSNDASDPNRPCELEVVDFRSPNKISGRMYLYDVSVYVVTKLPHQETVKAILADREALIKDRIRTIIAQSDPEKLGGGSEPGLETFRRQVKYQLDEIVGDGLIDDVLVPKCIPIRADF
jgi:flagellar basal body-associated protein FliL